jgi:hypothetical protein
MNHRMPVVVFLLLVVSPLSQGGELQEREKMKSNVSTLFLSENFSELERMANEYRTKQSRTASGLWKLTLFYAGIVQTANEENSADRYWTDLEAKTLRWANLYPNSPTPHIAHSIILIRHAWSYRGSGWAHEVHPESWKPFHLYIGKARQYLAAHKKVSKSDPRWYETMLVVARAENWDLADFNTLVEEAVSKHPNFYQIYFAAIDYLTPKWHGDKDKIEAFANYSANKTQSREGYSLYARVYWYASQAQYGVRLFTDSSVVWPRMKMGIDDVLARYPDQWNINNFSHFACLAGDRSKTKELIRLVDTPMPQVWKDPGLYDQCRSWATGGKEPNKSLQPTSALTRRRG